MRKILFHRQRSGGEYPRAWMTADLLGENFRDGQGRGVELYRVMKDFQPAHHVGLVIALPLFYFMRQLLTTLPTMLQPFTAFRLLLQQFIELQQLVVQRT